MFWLISLVVGYFPAPLNRRSVVREADTAAVCNCAVKAHSVITLSVRLYAWVCAYGT